uniref:Saposin B-type domain-containing protein n=1 Tax=Globisporangium ultimum (strain ATCC 200006 / CBS 805.95 / DAOM BR144) TaxID=431595 RepID=K3WJT1_GLOUD
MRATSLVGTLALALSLPTACAWTSRWDHSKRFAAAGYAQLECDGKTQPAPCCICNSIVHEIETQLNNTQDDYELDVVYRISEEKKKVKYSRSEGRILEVLDDICDQIPLRLPSTNKKSKNLLKETCTAFIGEYEDELTHAFFNNFAPVRDRVCTTELKVCEKVDGREEL